MTAKLDQRQTLLGLLVLAIGAFLAYVAFQSTTGPPFQAKYEINVNVPTDTPVLRRGQAVRIGGRLAGLVSKVTPNREDRVTTVTANITKPGFRPLPADTTAYVRAHSIVYETYLELRPGDSDEELEPGATISTPATSGVDLLEVVQLFDEQTRTELSETVVNVGVGVAGRGVELNQALNDLPQAARDLAAQLRAATREPGAISAAIAGAAGLARGLRGVEVDDVSALVEGADTTVAAIAAERSALGEAIELLPPFEDQVLVTAPVARPLLNDLAALSGDLEPAVRTVNRLLPDVNDLLDRGNSLREETRRITAVADPTLRTARPVAFELFPTLTALGPLNKNLAELKATVEPYKPEISQAGKWLADTTSKGAAQGLAPGARAARLVPVLTPHKCENPIPKPGQAQKDSC